MTETTKQCRLCFEEKPLSSFYRQAECRLGVRNECMKCTRDAKKSAPPEAVTLSEKKCSKCMATKPASEFSKNRGSRGGLFNWCKPCAKEHKDKRKAERKSLHTPSSVRSAVAAKMCKVCNEICPSECFKIDWSSSDMLSSACRNCTSKKEVNRRRGVPALVKKDKDLRKRFGISMDEYSEMLAFQGGVCAICMREDQVAGANLAVDHNHATGEVRGLLCRNCNSAIGKLRDDRETILRAFDYLDCPTTTSMKKKSRWRAA